MYSYCLYSVSFSNDYHFGFNGMEKDDEVFNVTGSSYTAEFWQYDSRIGRRWNVDPVNKLWKSSYATFANNPIYFVDPLGLDRGKPKPKRSKRRYSKYKWEFWKKRRIISNPDKGGGGIKLGKTWNKARSLTHSGWSSKINRIPAGRRVTQDYRFLTSGDTYRKDNQSIFSADYNTLILYKLGIKTSQDRIKALRISADRNDLGNFAYIAVDGNSGVAAWTLGIWPHHGGYNVTPSSFKNGDTTL